MLEGALKQGVQNRLEHLKAQLLAEADMLRLSVSAGPSGETIIDAGLTASGSIAAGLLIAELAMGGLGRVSLEPDRGHPDRTWTVAVRSSQPVLACLGSQFAGWQLSEPGRQDHALGSGPARALARREPIYDELGAAGRVAAPVLVVECRTVPSAETMSGIAKACAIEALELCLVLVPTTTLAGSVQVAARALEATVAKARHASFPVRNILDGLGTSPLAPPHPDPAVAMGRTNDAIIYGAATHLFVAGPAAEARDLAHYLPSCNSALHGRPFAEVLAEAGDFYAVDPLLFGPAMARVTAVESGETFTAGGAVWELVDRSFKGGRRPAASGPQGRPRRRPARPRARASPP